ncbi:MAG: nitroreductase family protein [Acidimicrobiia bacterium]
MDGPAFLDLVKRRRIVRNYTDEPVESAAVDRILDAARRGPSAGFSQGVSFVVVTAAPGRAAVAELAHEAEYVAAGFDPWISKAPVHIVVCVSEAVYRSRYREPDKSADGSEQDWPVPYWWVDAGAALMLVLLAAVAEGLAAGFLGSHALDRLAGTLGVPDDVAPIGIVTLGHPAPDRRSGSLHRGRKPWDEVVHRERWSGS